MFTYAPQIIVMHEFSFKIQEIDATTKNIT
jgi:hypothetical protein